MGYESRVIVARKNTMFKGYVEVIAELNLCVVDDAFLKLFTSEYKGHFYDFYAHNDTEIKVDRYNKPLTYTSFAKVYKWLLDNVQTARYIRYDMLLALLQTIRTGWADDTGEFILLHYGY